ncbi:unnamed protein product [Linum tenue]|uniref:Uncharacterized protein n=1 Tax=Linum tenue TaxID=586396 RepID=A0AAV0LFN6_9ROSI|nr:unnamed protein product [Linum tenue]
MGFDCWSLENKFWVFRVVKIWVSKRNYRHGEVPKTRDESPTALWLLAERENQQINRGKRFKGVTFVVGKTKDGDGIGKIGTHRQFFKIFALCAILCFSVACGNTSLLYLPVFFNQAIRAAPPFFTAIFAFLISLARRNQRGAHKGPSGNGRAERLWSSW